MLVGMPSRAASPEDGLCGKSSGLLGAPVFEPCWRDACLLLMPLWPLCGKCPRRLSTVNRLGAAGIF